MLYLRTALQSKPQNTSSRMFKQSHILSELYLPVDKSQQVKMPNVPLINAAYIT